MAAASTPVFEKKHYLCRRITIASSNKEVKGVKG